MLKESKKEVNWNDRLMFLLGKIGEARKSQVRNLVGFLEGQRWGEAPLTARRSMAKAGGLLRHSIAVAENMLMLKTALAPEISDESCVILGLFHDVGKLGAFHVSYFVKRYEGDENIGYHYNPKVMELSLATRSIWYITHFIPLTEAEIQALDYMNVVNAQKGFYGHKESGLTLLLSWADYWTGHIQEAEFDPNSYNEGIRWEER